ncbi:MAG: hypothetical protein ABIO91_01730 [Pyrinomonadaceae bacterium]
MCKKSVVAILLIVFSIAAARAGGVTNVKEIINNTSVILEVSKLEPKLGNPYSGDHTGEIAANGGVWTGDMWIPWVNNEQDGRDRWMGIYYNASTGNNRNNQIEFFIWQTGDYVRYSKKQYIQNAPKIPGESKSGGERRLIISEKDKKFFIRFEKL